MGRRLTPKQERFVQEYLIDLNATGAARRAGYSIRTADRIGPELLGKPCVAEAIQSAQQTRRERMEIEADRVVAELAAIAFGDPGDVLDFTAGTVPRLRPVDQIPEKARRSLSSVKVRREQVGRGDEAEEVEVVEFRFWDKLAALDKLGRHLGMFQGDGAKVSVSVTSGGGGPPIDLARLTDEQLQQLREIVRAGRPALDAAGRSGD